MDGSPVMAGSLAAMELRRAVEEVLRSEFSQLQQTLIQAVRSELDLKRQGSGDTEGNLSKLAKAGGKMQGGMIRMRGFLPLKTYKVKQYQKWLAQGEQDDDADLDVDFAESLQMDANAGAQVKDADQASPSSNQIKRMDADTDHYLPNTPMPPHPPSHDDQGDDEEEDTDEHRGMRRSRTCQSTMSTASAGAQRHRAPQLSVSRTEKAMGLGPKSNTMNLDDENRYQETCVKIVRSIRFEFTVMTMVMLSAIHIGWQTDHMARHLLKDVPPAFRALDIIFMIFFAAELFLKLFAFRKAFFFMWGWGWNILDLVLVIMQVVEEIAHIVISSGGQGLQAALSTSIILKILRILRFVRVIRVLHVMRFADELRLLVSCIVHSAKAFCWSTALLVLILYVMAVNLVALTLTERLDAGVDDLSEFDSVNKLSHWYGTVPRAVLSLFQGLTGGLDWNELVEPFMIAHGAWMGVVFFFYMAFVILAVMNVVTATFVEQAIERASKVKEIQKVSHASRLFKSIDMDNSGVITYNEIASHLESRAVKDFFKSIDVDVTEAQWLFELLDHDNSGELEFGEFLTGCLRLQGPAKSIDLVLVMRELKEALKRF